MDDGIQSLRGKAALLVLPIALGYLLYEAILAPARGTNGDVAILGFVLVVLAVAYVRRCLKTMGAGRPSPRQLSMFLLTSMVSLASLLLGFSGVYRVAGLVPTNAGVAENGEAVCREPLACLYFSVITWTTVGFGDLIPTPAARPYAAIEALLGYVFMGLFITTLVNVAIPPAREGSHHSDVVRT